MENTLEDVQKSIEILQLKHASLTLKYIKLKKKYKAVLSEIHHIMLKQKEMEEMMFGEDEEEYGSNESEEMEERKK